VCEKKTNLGKDMTGGYKGVNNDIDREYINITKGGGE
jgi:hypothetical protein